MRTLHILIAGCGYVGTALGRRLAAEGHIVWGLRRSPKTLPDDIRPLATDLREPATLRILTLCLVEVLTCRVTAYTASYLANQYVPSHRRQQPGLLR